MARMAAALSICATLMACGDGDRGEPDPEPCGDEVAPRVTGEQRLRVETGAESGSYALTFDEPVSGVDTTTVTLQQTRGEGADTSLELVDDGTSDSWTVNFSPAGWQDGDRFVLTVSSDVHDGCDNTLAEEFVVMD